MCDFVYAGTCSGAGVPPGTTGSDGGNASTTGSRGMNKSLLCMVRILMILKCPPPWFQGILFTVQL